MNKLSLLFLFLSLGLIGGVFYVIFTSSEVIEPEEVDVEPEPVVCTMDAKICPDGSSVGRIPPKCEFSPCPVVKQPVVIPESIATTTEAANGTTTVESSI